MAKAKKTKPETITNKSTKEAIKFLQQHFGKESVVDWKTRTKDVDVISTGCLGLDYVTGIWGIPKGRIVEVFGPESSGKTTLALHIIKSAQDEGGVVAYLDSEHAIDPIYASNLGVDVEDMLVCQPDSAEETLNIVEALVNSNAADLIIVDSVAALVPKAELAGESGDSHMGLMARLMSQHMRKIVGGVHKSNTCVIFINQVRQNIGPFGGEVTTGGKALKFYCSLRMDIRRIKTLKDSSEKPVGNRTKVTIKKNKLAPPFDECEFDILYGKGIDNIGNIVDLGVENRILQKNGAWYSFDNTNIGQGKPKTVEFLEQDTDTFDALHSQVKEALKVKAKKKRDKLAGITSTDSTNEEEEVNDE